MLTFSKHLSISKRTIEAPNLAGMLDEEDLKALGLWCYDGYTKDLSSRSVWFRRNEAGMELAMQIQRAKSFPWPGCSNVAFPLITIATMQFHSRAYPELIPGREIVQYETWGLDPDGQEGARAARIGEHMSYQCLREDTGWEEVHDRLLINYAIVGSAFIKTKRQQTLQRNISEFVPAKDLVLDYYAQKIETCRRKTHIVRIDRNTIRERILEGSFVDISQAPWYQEPAPLLPSEAELNFERDIRVGVSRPSSEDELVPFTFLEQHTFVDLDGDGYAEPVIVTLEASTQTVVRVVYRFEREEDIIRNIRKDILHIIPLESFTKFEFIPSPDGGVYGLGWGLLLGPINESVNSAINQLIDAGTMSNAAGGFLGRGAKLKGGVYTFAPFQWQPVDAGGQNLKDNIFPLPVREPSAVLFNLLSLLVDYANRVSASVEILVGENPGQNTPATTTQTMVEEGMRIFTAIFKRAWRSLKEEFEKLYTLNAIYMPPGTRSIATREDYLGDPSRVMPTADPTAVSESQRLKKAIMVKQSAMTTPGYDLPAVERNFLKTLRVPAWQQLYLGPDKVPPLPNPRVQVEQFKLQGKLMELKQKKLEWAAQMLESVRLDDAKIEQLRAQAAKLVADAGGVEAGHQIAAFEAAIEAIKTHSDSVLKQVELMMKAEGASNDDGRGVPGVEGKPVHEGGNGPPAEVAGGVQGEPGQGVLH